MAASSTGVVVIGGGVAGVSAATELHQRGVEVTVLETDQRLGGCVRTVPFHGARVDIGAEALHTASPEPLKLIADLGLTADLVEAQAAPSWIATPRGLQALPAGIGPAGPTRIRPLVGSGLLGPGGLLRAAMEPLVPAMADMHDASVGDVLARRFGRQVVDRIIDPLLGGLHAGDVYRLGLDDATPQLAALLGSRRSVVLAARARRAGAGYGFVTLRGGLGRMFDTWVEQFRGDLRTGVGAEAIVDTGRTEGRYRVETDAGALDADGVVVAVPTRAAADLVTPLDLGAAALLRTVAFASVAMTVFAYPATARTSAALRGTGVLVPSSAGRLLKAATFLSTKWPHLDSAHVLVRASAGRANDDRPDHLDDAALADHLAHDLQELAGIDATPDDRLVVRWPAAMPQLEVGHRRRIEGARRQLAAHPTVALAGASYDGVGVGAATRSGLAAARHLLDQLDLRPGAPR